MDAVTLAICEDLVGEAVGNLEPGYAYKGSVATVSDLPGSGNTKGDLYQIRADGSERVWDGSQWVPREKCISTSYIDSLFA